MPALMLRRLTPACEDDPALPTRRRSERERMAPATTRMLGLAAGAALTITAFLSHPAFANDAEPPWGVLIAGSFYKGAALAEFARAQRAYAGVIGGMDPFVCSSILKSLGGRPFYRVRLGAQSRSEAERLCSQLQAAGGDCIVIRDCE